MKNLTQEGGGGEFGATRIFSSAFNRSFRGGRGQDLLSTCLFINASMNFILVGNIIISNPCRPGILYTRELIFIFIFSGTILRFLTRWGGEGRGWLKERENISFKIIKRKLKVKTDNILSIFYFVVFNKFILIFNIFRIFRPFFF